jgi:hypothetical protein
VGFFCGSDHVFFSVLFLSLPVRAGFDMLLGFPDACVYYKAFSAVERTSGRRKKKKSEEK